MLFVVFDCGEILRDTTDVVSCALLGGMVIRGQISEGWAGSKESEEVWGQFMSHVREYVELI